MTETIYDIPLPGCTPEPLMGYLKALGILRLVSEQEDREACGYWRNDVFVLYSKLDQSAITHFFLSRYQPTPLVGPWGARSGFYNGPSERTAREALNAVLASEDARFVRFKEMVIQVRALLKERNISEKPKDEEKLALLTACRTHLPDEILPWLDTCYVLLGDERRFPPLLGTGGNEGSGSYFSGFAQQLVACLLHRKHDQALETALFGTTRSGVYADQTPGHFSPTAARGVNATQGFEGSVATNPWDYLLALEGTCLWASGIVRRLGQTGPRMASFPFTVNVSGVGSGSLVSADGTKPKQAKRDIAEMWLPMWSRPSSLRELTTLLAEGRASVGRRLAVTGVDMARAAAELGVDRGISAFKRSVFLMRNGRSFLAIPTGSVSVHQQESVDLLRQLDPWLDRFRKATGGKNVPARFVAALRNIDSAIFDFCRYGGKPLFQCILITLGRAERELALTEGKVGKRQINPLVGLSRGWIDAAYDNSPEFDVALALSQMHDPAYKIGPLRTNLEPVTIGRKKSGDLYSNWAEKDRCVVWNAADLATNLANTLQRRLMDGQRNESGYLPITSRFTASLDTVAAFIEGKLDDRRIDELIWALMLVDGCGASQPNQSGVTASEIPLPREYALLRLLYLPRPLVAHRKDDRIIWRLAPEGESGIPIRLELRILPLLRTGRVGEACQIAAQRLRVSGLLPMPGLVHGKLRDDQWVKEWKNREVDYRRAQRSAAALLIPVEPREINEIVQLVCRHTSIAAGAL